jgi:hypothetical protein
VKRKKPEKWVLIKDSTFVLLFSLVYCFLRLLKSQSLVLVTNFYLIFMLKVILKYSKVIGYCELNTNPCLNQGQCQTVNATAYNCLCNRNFLLNIELILRLIKLI